jgi:hypothetical protein
MATKERLAAMAASRCAVCSGAMALTLVKADLSNSALELRTYICAGSAATVKPTASPPATADGPISVAGVVLQCSIFQLAQLATRTF